MTWLDVVLALFVAALAWLCPADDQQVCPLCRRRGTTWRVVGAPYKSICPDCATERGAL